jgi:putative flippase GtrA
MIKNNEHVNIRYLIVGAVNTFAGYMIGVYTYNLFINVIGVWGVGLVANVFAVTFSFVTNKLLVFQSSGNWMLEYIKSHMVNGVMAVLSIFLLWIFTEKMEISIWISQAIIIACVAISSYISHKNFTFK